MWCQITQALTPLSIHDIILLTLLSPTFAKAKAGKSENLMRKQTLFSKTPRGYLRGIDDRG